MAENSTPAISGNKRIEFLDFIRGLAALAVAIGHSTEKYNLTARHWLFHEFSLGIFGVTAFFILSGFVIPFTIERYKNLKLFWINRFFRLFPLYWISLIVVTIVLLSALHPGLSPYERTLPVSFLFNLTMLQGFAHQEHAMGLYWTLGYELVFYGLMSALFAVGWNKKSGWLLTVGTVAIAAIGLGFAAMRGAPKFPFTIFFLSCFFFGTAVYRFWSGDMPKRAFLWFTGSFVAVAFAAAWFNFIILKSPYHPDELQTITSFRSWIAGFIFFLGVTFGPKFKVPEVFLWLGRISYSVYVLHGILVTIRLPFDPTVNIVVTVALTLVLATLSFKYIETPFQELGKRLIKRLREPSPAQPTEAS